MCTPLSVMVGDDEKELAELFSVSIELSGFNWDYFTDSQLALDNFTKNPNSYCLIIADLRTPGLDGLELIKRIRQYNKRVKIILVSGFLAEENTNNNEIKDVGISVVIEKPFHFKELRPIIKRVLVE